MDCIKKTGLIKGRREGERGKEIMGKEEKKDGEQEEEEEGGGEWKGMMMMRVGDEGR